MMNMDVIFYHANVSTFIGMLTVCMINSSPYTLDTWLAVTTDERRTRSFHPPMDEVSKIVFLPTPNWRNRNFGTLRSLISLTYFHTSRADRQRVTTYFSTWQCIMLTSATDLVHIASHARRSILRRMLNINLRDGKKDDFWCWRAKSIEFAKVNNDLVDLN